MSYFSIDVKSFDGDGGQDEILFFFAVRSQKQVDCIYPHIRGLVDGLEEYSIFTEVSYYPGELPPHEGYDFWVTRGTPYYGALQDIYSTLSASVNMSVT